MDISISSIGNDLNVKVIGPITEADGDSLKKAFDQIVQATEEAVRINLSMVPIITSTGIGKIIVLFRKLKSQGRNLVIAGIHENLLAMFTSINLDKMLTIEK